MAERVDATPAGIARAADALRVGALVAFPTETVYGLGADARQADAVARIFAAKGRPADNPLIVHVRDADAARSLVSAWPASAAALAARFWPGPLALVLPKSDAVPSIVTAGRDTVAVRAPRHPVAQALLAAFGGPIAAPSANRSGLVSPTTAQHVLDDHPDHDFLVLDGGPCAVGVESTVLDLAHGAPRILRPGGATPEEIAAVTGPVAVPEIRAQDASPGTALRHYAPRTPCRMVDGAELGAALAAIAAAGGRAVVLGFDPDAVPAPHAALAMPHGAGDYARTLYDALRRADALGGAAILVERTPESNAMWRAVSDRLRRACADATGDGAA